jgi:transcriptional regulator with XRE-family HTH domain
LNFKQLIDSKGLTMYKLAKDAGVGKSTVSQLATGKRKTAYMGTLVKIAKALNVSVDDVCNSLKEGE